MYNDNSREIRMLSEHIVNHGEQDCITVTDHHTGHTDHLRHLPPPGAA